MRSRWCGAPCNGWNPSAEPRGKPGGCRYWFSAAKPQPKPGRARLRRALISSEGERQPLRAKRRGSRLAKAAFSLMHGWVFDARRRKSGLDESRPTGFWVRLRRVEDSPPPPPPRRPGGPRPCGPSAKFLHRLGVFPNKNQAISRLNGRGGLPSFALVWKQAQQRITRRRSARPRR
jgi:hypothetical protein